MHFRLRPSQSRNDYIYERNICRLVFPVLCHDIIREMLANLIKNKIHNINLLRESRVI